MTSAKPKKKIINRIKIIQIERGGFTMNYDFGGKQIDFSMSKIGILAV